MKQGLTELVIILDKSGSMGGLESNAIDGFNSMLLKYEAVDGERRIRGVMVSACCLENRLKK